MCNINSNISNNINVLIMCNNINSNIINIINNSN